MAFGCYYFGLLFGALVFIIALAKEKEAHCHHRGAVPRRQSGCEHHWHIWRFNRWSSAQLTAVWTDWLVEVPFPLKFVMVSLRCDHKWPNLCCGGGEWTKSRWSAVGWTDGWIDGCGWVMVTCMNEYMNEWQTNGGRNDQELLVGERVSVVWVVRKCPCLSWKFAQVLGYCFTGEALGFFYYFMFFGWL